MKQNFKIALYVRVSTEEQAENPEGSIKNQEERLREFVKLKNMVGPFGEIREVFTDAGISAKDMNRPAFQRLLRKIEDREINLVLVTELSRFTRSIKDFSILWEFLAKHECKFLSIKDNFDTSTAAGEMVMYMMANVAQFERKQTAERISHSFLARAKRGLYNGGTLPLGYEVDPVKPGSLAIVAEEAEIVREVFRVFLKEETLAKTAKKLNEMGLKFPRTPRSGGKPRTGIFRIDMVHTILKNKAYIGVRVFEGKDGKEEAQAVWKPILDGEVFERAVKLLEKNRYRKRSHVDLRYPYTLSGICFCKTCGDRMSGKSAHGRTRKVPYYEHAWATKHQAALSRRINQCDPHRIQAEKIEPMVWQEVKRFLVNEDVTRHLLTIAESMKPENAVKTEEEKAEKKVQAIQNQMEALAERIARPPKGIDERVFLDQMRKLQEARGFAEAALTEIHNKPQAEDVVAYGDFMKFTAGLRERLAKADTRPEIQAEIIRKLVHRVEITMRGFEIEFFVGAQKIKRELGSNPGSLTAPDAHNADMSGAKDKARPSAGLPGFRPSSPPLSKFLKVGGSKRLTNGGRGAQLSTPPLKFNVPHDIIKFFPKSQERIFEVSAPLYESGYTLREIESKTGFAKSSIRQALTASGLTLRVGNRKPTTKAKRAFQASSPVQRYGYARLEGQLVKDPKEYRNVLQILKLWQSGKSLTAIANHLNDRKVPPRRGLRWHHETVHQIVKHETQNKEK